LIAVTEEDGHEVEHGVVRYVTNPDLNSCEFALVISDEFQGHGIGQRMMKRLMETARARGLDMMEGEVLTANHRMLDLVRSMGFQVQHSSENPGVQYVWTEL
jgi:acetyltransferase